MQSPLGPQPRLTPKVAGEVEKMARVGATFETCADYAGISPGTLLGWLQRGRLGALASEAGVALLAGESCYVDLFRAVLKARAEREAESALRLRDRDDGWKADAFWLQHVRPKDGGALTDAVLADTAFLDGLRAQCEGMSHDDDSDDRSRHRPGVDRRAEHESIADAVQARPEPDALPARVRRARLRDLPLG